MRTDILTVGSRHFQLAQGQSLDDLKAQAVEAARDVGLVTFVEVGNRQVSVLVTRGVAMTFETIEREEDARDTGDVEHPYDPDELYDPYDTTA